MLLDITNIDFVSRNSTRLPPRTPLEVGKIFCLGIFWNSHGSFVSSRWVRIWNRNLSSLSRFRVISVFASSRYVFCAIFAVRAPLRGVFLVLSPWYELSRSLSICTVIFVVFWLLKNFLPPLLSRVFAENPLLAVFRLFGRFFITFSRTIECVLVQRLVSLDILPPDGG